MTPRPRIALVVDEETEPRSWLSRGFDIVAVSRGRHLAADLAASGADLIVLETVHPSEAGWLLSWVRAQPRLAPKPVLMVLPFGPAPRARGAAVAFVEKPLDRARFVKQVERLLQREK